MAGRPHKIVGSVAEIVDDLAARGMNQSAIVRALGGRGVSVTRATLRRYLDAHPPALRPLPGPAEAATSTPDADLPSLERDAAGALADDDLTRLLRAAEAAERIMRSWAERADYDPAAARTWATVSRVHSDLRARLVELRPRPEAEADRMSALSAPARNALLERARAAAEPDWRGRYQRAEQLIERLGK